ncbi:MAG: TerB family tellurite resistance protein [Myxococcota bacterium]
MVPDFFAPTDLDFEQVKVMTHAMMALARVDGVHDNEMRLVREFYDGCSRPGDPELEEVVRGTFDPAQAKARFGSDAEHRDLFIKSLILMALADGEYGAQEDELIRSWAQEVGATEADVERLKEATSEYLMAGLSHIRNDEALKDVRRKLP